MPDAFEFPGMLGSVVPLMCRKRFPGFRRRVVNELVAFTFRESIRSRHGFSRRCSGLVPGLTAIVRSLDELAEPSAGLRHIDTVWIERGSLHVVDLPAGEVRTANIPPITLAV